MQIQNRNERENTDAAYKVNCEPILLRCEKLPKKICYCFEQHIIEQLHSKT